MSACRDCPKCTRLGIMKIPNACNQILIYLASIELECRFIVPKEMS